MIDKLGHKVISDLYEQFKDEDGFLYIYYSQMEVYWSTVSYISYYNSFKHQHYLKIKSLSIYYIFYGIFKLKLYIVHN